MVAGIALLAGASVGAQPSCPDGQESFGAYEYDGRGGFTGSVAGGGCYLVPPKVKSQAEVAAEEWASVYRPNTDLPTATPDTGPARDAVYTSGGVTRYVWIPRLGNPPHGAVASRVIEAHRYLDNNGLGAYWTCIADGRSNCQIPPPPCTEAQFNDGNPERRCMRTDIYPKP